LNMHASRTNLISDPMIAVYTLICICSHPENTNQLQLLKLKKLPTLMDSKMDLERLA
jgi:hypothetical protein